MIVSTDDMDNFEEKEMKKAPPFKNTWYDWLVSCILEPIIKSLGCIIDEIISLFKTNSPRQTVYWREKKLNKSEKIIINRFRNLFILKKKKNELNIEHLVILGQFLITIDDDYYKPKRVSNVCNNNYIGYESYGDRNKKFITRWILRQN